MSQTKSRLPWMVGLGVVVALVTLAVGWGHLFYGPSLVAEGADLCAGMEEARFNSADTFWFIGDDGEDAVFLQKTGPFDHRRYRISWQTLPQDLRYRVQGGYWLPRWRWVNIKRVDLTCGDDPSPSTPEP